MICAGGGCVGLIPCCFSWDCASARLDDSRVTAFDCCACWTRSPSSWSDAAPSLASMNTSTASTTAARSASVAGHQCLLAEPLQPAHPFGGFPLVPSQLITQRPVLGVPQLYRQHLCGQRSEPIGVGAVFGFQACYRTAKLAGCQRVVVGHVVPSGNGEGTWRRRINPWRAWRPGAARQLRRAGPRSRQRRGAAPARRRGRSRRSSAREPAG